MKMFNGVKFQLLSGTLYNAAMHYWKLNQPANEKLKKDYVTWLHFFYALNRNSDIAIPISKNLKELGYVTEARNMLEDLIAFLSLQEDSEKEIEKIKMELER